jgi:hypothetical protein
MRARWLMIPSMLTSFAAGPLAAQSPVGEWALRVEWPGGPATVKLVVSDSAGARHVSWEGRQGHLTASNVEWEDGAIRFALAVEDENGRALQLRFNADVTDDLLHGEIALPNEQAFSVTGVRATAAPGDSGGTP